MKIVIAGLGLIGGSIYKAALAAGHEAVGLHHGDDAAAALVDADVVYVAQPPEAIVPWIRANEAHFKPGAIVTDVCGVKRDICAAFRETGLHAAWHFVGGHPMAGKEVSGYANSTPDLFKGASMIFTPFPYTGRGPLDALERLSHELGFKRVVFTTPEHHDEMIAFTSQLCHVIATAYSRDVRVKDSVGFSAGSYANMTRIATQDEAVWSSLYLDNRQALLDVLDGFMGRLAEFRATLAAGEVERMKAIIVEGTNAKRAELQAQRL